MMWRRNMSKCCLAHRSLLCCFPRSCSGRWLPAWRSVEPGVLWYQWDLFIVMSLNSESIEDIWNAEGWRALTIDFWFDSLICFSSSFCMFSFSLPRHFDWCWLHWFPPTALFGSPSLLWPSRNLQILYDIFMTIVYGALALPKHGRFTVPAFPWFPIQYACCFKDSAWGTGINFLMETGGHWTNPSTCEEFTRSF